MNHIEAIEGFEVAIAALLEKMYICEFYAGIYFEVLLPPQLRGKLDSALPEFYAAVIVFSMKARAYFEAKGMYVPMSYMDIKSS